MLSLRYFGPFEARGERAAIPLPTRPVAWLLALLAAEPGRRHRRESVAQAIWTDADHDRALASLRTGLTMLRRSVGAEVVGTDREWLWVEPGVCESDRSRFRAALRRESLETDDERRERLLCDLAEVPPLYLEDWLVPWAVTERREHERTVARIAIELARMRLASREFEEARALAMRCLALRPGAAAASEIAARAAAALGRRDEARRLAESVRDEAARARLVAEIAAASPAGPRPPPPDLLAEAYRANLADDPDAAVRFLVGHHSFWWRQREFERAKGLLRLGLDSPLSDATRARAWHLLGMLLHRTGDAAEAYDATREVLRLDPEPGLRNDTRMLGACCLMDSARWDDARKEMESHLALMSSEPRDYRTNWVQINMAGLEIAHGRFEAARASLDESEREVVADPFRRRYGAAHVALQRAVLALAVEDWGEAKRFAGSAAEVLSPEADPHAAAAPRWIHLVARIRSGDADALEALVRVPLDPVRAGMRAVAVAAFDAAAEGLAFAGRGEAAMRLFAANGALRERIGLPRSPLGLRQMASAAAESARRPGPPTPPPAETTPAALAAWTANLAP